LSQQVVQWLLIGLPVLGTVTGSLRADLRFDRTSVDTGVAYTGRPLACAFVFLNAGTATIEIREVRASCGCLTPQIKQRTYKPGEKGTIDLEVNTFSQADGSHTWVLQVRFQEGDRFQEQTLELHARLVTEIRLQPAALVMVADGEASHPLTITDLRPKPIKIKEARSSMAGVNVDVAPVERDSQARWLYRARVRATAEVANGRHDGFIEFVTDDSRYEILRVPITVIKRYQARLTATPAEVTLIAPPGQPFPSRLVLVRDQEGEKIQIDAVTADDPAVQCRWADGPGQLGTAKIRADRSGIHGELQTVVHVHLSQPISAWLLIPVRCVAH
jgi:Protein of unknown function (DUF1573)